MDVRIKSYATLSEALSDQAHLKSKGVHAEVQNSHDIHPSLLGQVFLVVKKEDAVKAVKHLNEILFES